MEKYTIEERKFVVLFTFKSHLEAQLFILPKKYMNNYVLNDVILDEGPKKGFIRVAQVK